MIPITSTASVIEGTRVQTVPAHCADIVIHELPMVVGACPVSRNPVSGTVRVRYAPRSGPDPWVVCEVVSLHEALAFACSGDETAPRSVESLAAWLGDQVFKAVRVRVRVELDLMVLPGPQRLIVRYWAG